MRVLFIAHSFPRYSGDVAGSFLLRLAVALRADGVEVRVVAPAAPGYPAADVLDGIAVRRFRYAPRRAERLAYTGNMAEQVARSWTARMAMASFLGADFIAAARLRRAFAPDLIHAHWWFPGGVAGAWLAALSGLPLVTTMHGSDIRLARGVAAARPVLRHVVRRSAVVTTVSTWLAGELKSIVPAAQPEVAPMPVDIRLFSAGGNRDRRRVLFVGRLTEQKGIAHLIRAMAMTKTGAELDVVGNGVERESLELLASEQGVAGRIRWHGALPPEQLPEMYRSSGAVIVPSIEEGLGLVAVEALLCGAPVVASRSGGLTDVVRDGSTGVLVPPAEPGALAMAIDELLGNPERADALGEAGRQYALASFAPESVASRYAEFYRRALGNPEA